MCPSLLAGRCNPCSQVVASGLVGVIPTPGPRRLPTQAPCSVVLQQLAALFPRIPSRRERAP